MKKLFITGPRHIVSAFIMRNIDKGYSPEEIKDNGENVAVMLTKEKIHGTMGKKMAA